MTQSIFDIDTSEFELLAKLYKRSPVLFKKSTAGQLNSMAFAARSNYLHEIKTTMQVRNPRFVSNSLKVTKAKPSQNINSQESQSFSVIRPRFSGWEEQETGKKPKTNRVYTQAGRKNKSFKNRLRPKYKLRSKNRIRKPSEFKRKGGRVTNSISAMLRAAREGEFKGMMEIPKGGRGKFTKKMKPGIYAVEGREIFRVHTFGQKFKVDRNRWMTRGNDKITNADMRRMWADNLKHYTRGFTK